jgi:hypothetical protein
MTEQKQKTSYDTLRTYEFLRSYLRLTIMYRVRWDITHVYESTFLV